jgi:hypothetical protein
MKKIILLIALAITTISCTKDDDSYTEPFDYASNNYGSSRGAPVESFDFTTSAIRNLSNAQRLAEILRLF